MSDDKSRIAPRDAKRVSVSEDYEVQYWTNRFDVTRSELENAVDEVGVSVNAVAAYFARRK